MPTNIRKKHLLLIAVTLIFPFFFIGGPSDTSLRVFPAIWNLGHIGFFGLVTALLLDWAPKLRPGRGTQNLFILSALVLAAGTIIEILQFGTSREPDLHDIWRNLIGSWLAWAWYMKPSLARLRAIIVLSFLLALEFLLIGIKSWVYCRIQNQIPLVSELEYWRDVRQWSGKVALTQEIASEGKASMRVEIDSVEYSGATLHHLPCDWRGYKWLKFELFNPGPGPLAINLRINDKEHEHGEELYKDRFNTRLEAKPGWNHFEIELDQVRKSPHGREMDMAGVYKVIIFTTRLPVPRVMYLDYFRLE